MDKTKKKIDGKTIGNAAPYIGLVLVVIVFEILTQGKVLSGQNIQNMINDIIVTGLVTIGAVFVFGSGFFDMSMGGSICLCAVVGGMVAVATGSLPITFLAILVLSLGLGLVKGLIAAFIDVPFFIFTIVIGSVISSGVIVMMGDTSTINLKNAVSEIPAFNFSQMALVSGIVLLVFFLICVVLFNYTPLGLKVKSLGGNIFATKQSGIDTRKTTIATFLLAAVGIALAAFVVLVRTRSVTAQTCGSVGNDVMVALVLGGMPLSGGPRSKISAGIVGAVTITVLNSGLTIMGLNTGAIQICRGIIFIVVVFVSSFSYRGRLLAR